METENLIISCVLSDIEKLLKFKRHRKRMENEQTDYICICLFFQKFKKLNDVSNVCSHDEHKVCFSFFFPKDIYYKFIYPCYQSNHIDT